MQRQEAIIKEYLDRIQTEKQLIISRENIYNEENIRYLWKQLDLLEDRMRATDDLSEAMHLFKDSYLGKRESKNTLL